jgi:hypothetical protein
LVIATEACHFSPCGTAAIRVTLFRAGPLP